MKSVGLRISGNIISELSDKIPTHIVALNELIKNSYDAFATEVIITLDTINKKLVIKDNGLGMDELKIKKLFHISNSDKKYGKLVNNKEKNLKRYTQGSKGLGFLSVFKFGTDVTWVTNKNNKKITFSVNKDKLTSLKNVASYRLEPKEEISTEIGTTILIELNQYENNELEKYFAQDKNIKKIINAFYDDQFKIILKTNHGSYESEMHENFRYIDKEDQLFYITYSSEKAKIEFFYRGRKIDGIPYDINTKEYELDIELIAYNFKSGGTKKISQLYYREHDDALTPLIYINNNLFHNYTLFDASQFRKKRSGDALPQLIGYIKIISSHSQMEFNSDRTNFVQNELTSNIEYKLKELNENIQKIGSELKNSLKDQEGNVKTGAAYPYTKETSSSSKDKENIFQPRPAQINLQQKLKRITIPSRQMDLLKEITFACNSSGEWVDPVQNILIEIDGERATNFILESQEVPCEKLITYIYHDSKTGRVVDNLKLIFELPEAKITAKGKKSLFNLPLTRDYKINIPYVSSLIIQLEDLYKQKGKYNEIIACALRSIFELCSDYLKNKDSNIFPIPLTIQKLESSVEYIIEFVALNDKLKTELSKTIPIDYKSFNKLLDKEAFLNMVKKAHLGAHKSMFFLTDSEIKDIAKKAGIFAVLSDALLYNVSESIISDCKKPEPLNSKGK